MSSNTLAKAIQLREQKQYAQAETLLRELLTSNPTDPQVNYHLAWTCDAQGKESDAVPFYKTAITNGLSGEDLRRALLGLGSTYRALGRYQEAVETLQRGHDKFPDAHEFSIFLAMALYNLERHDEAMQILLQTIVETTDDAGIQRFRRAITFYSDKLNQTWE